MERLTLNNNQDEIARQLTYYNDDHHHCLMIKKICPSQNPSCRNNIDIRQISKNIRRYLSFLSDQINNKYYLKHVYSLRQSLYLLKENSDSDNLSSYKKYFVSMDDDLTSLVNEIDRVQIMKSDSSKMFSVKLNLIVFVILLVNLIVIWGRKLFDIVSS